MTSVESSIRRFCTSRRDGWPSRRAGLSFVLILAAGAYLASFGTAASAKPAVPSAPAGLIPQLTYTKVLKGSLPEYERISVNSNGFGVYDGRKLNGPSAPRRFKLSAPIVRRVFSLASALNNFQSCSLESHKRVANLGRKTFEYEANGQHYKCEFNYSTNHTAQELTDLLESVGAVERHIIALDYAMKYDHLGLPRELTLIQIDLNNKALADPQLMVDALEKIAKDPRFLHLAQVRAGDILHQIQRGR